MKSGRFCVLMLLLAATPTFGQAVHDHTSPAKSVAAEADAAFAKLKSLAGSWVGRLTVTPAMAAVDGKLVQLSMQVTSRGHALAHEVAISGLPDHPLTMFYLDGDRLSLTHYCDAGNRPRMAGTLSPDGKTLTFEFVDLSGSNERGHMHRAVFTFIDENQHVEEWTYLGPGDMPMRARFDLQRTNFEGASAR